MLTLCRAARPLHALHRQSTYYEAGLFDGAGQLVAVLAYDAKRTRRALLHALMQHGPEIAALCSVNANDCAVDWVGGAAVTIGDSGFAVRWTGSTEYERASEAARHAA